MLSGKLGFAVVLATLITIGVAVPAHAITVKVFKSDGTQCGNTLTGTDTVSVSAASPIVCDFVAVSFTVTAATNGTTRQFSVTNYLADSNTDISKTIRVNATHNFSGAASTAGIGWSGTFKRGTLVTNVAKSSGTCVHGLGQVSP